MQTLKPIKHQPFELPEISHYPQNPLPFRIAFNGLPLGVVPTAELVENRSGKAFPAAYQPATDFDNNTLSGLFAPNQLSRFGSGAIVEISWSGQVRMTLPIDVSRSPVSEPPAEGTYNVEVAEDGYTFNVTFSEAGFVADAKAYKEQAEAARDQAQDLIDSRIYFISEVTNGIRLGFGPTAQVTEKSTQYGPAITITI